MGHQARLYKETPQSVAAGHVAAEIERLAGLAEKLKARQLNPLPWSRVGIAISEPLAVPEIRDVATFEHFRRRAKRELDNAAATAKQALVEKLESAA